MKFLDQTIHRLCFSLQLATSERHWRAALRRINFTGGKPWQLLRSDAVTHSFCEDKKDKIIDVIVTINPGKRKLPTVAALLAHEAKHVFDAHCSEIGEDRPSVEFYAYGIQFVTEHC